MKRKHKLKGHFMSVFEDIKYKRAQSKEKKNDDYMDNTNTLNYYVKEYLDLKKQLLEPSTLSTMNYMYNKYIKEEIGDMNIKDIKRSVIKKYYISLFSEKKLAISTISRVDSILSPVFDSAVYDEILMRNPAKGVCSEIKKEIHIGKNNINVLTPEELNKFMRFVISNRKCRDSFKNLLFVLCGTGMRVGEVTALTWSDVDFEHNIISVNKSMGYMKNDDGHEIRFIKRPKTGAGIRQIPMTGFVKKALIKEKESQEAATVVMQEQAMIDDIKGFCFLSSRKTPYNRDSINSKIKRMIVDYNKLCLTEEDRLPVISTHSIRHTFATALCQSTGDMKAIQEIMGHSDIAITLNIYAEATDKGKVMAMGNFEKIMDFK